MENQPPQDRKVILFIYDMVIILSGMYIIELMWDSGFYLDNVLIYSGLWFLFALVFYLPTRARSKVIP